MKEIINGDLISGIDVIYTDENFPDEISQSGKVFTVEFVNDVLPEFEKKSIVKNAILSKIGNNKNDNYVVWIKTERKDELDSFWLRQSIVYVFISYE